MSGLFIDATKDKDIRDGLRQNLKMSVAELIRATNDSAPDASSGLTRIANALLNKDIYILAQLVVLREKDLQEFRNFGRKSLMVLKELLMPFNFHLGMPVDQVQQMLGSTIQEVVQAEGYEVTSKWTGLFTQAINPPDSTHHTAQTTLSFGELRNANSVRSDIYWNRVYTPAQWMTAMVGEVGELANKLADRWKYQHDMPNNKGAIAKEEIAHEMADIICYLDHLARATDVDLGEAVRTKFNLVSDRLGSDIKL